MHVYRAGGDWVELPAQFPQFLILQLSWSVRRRLSERPGLRVPQPRRMNMGFYRLLAMAAAIVLLPSITHGQAAPSTETAAADSQTSIPPKQPTLPGTPNQPSTGLAGAKAEIAR